MSDPRQAFLTGTSRASYYDAPGVLEVAKRSARAASRIRSDMAKNRVY